MAGVRVKFKVAAEGPGGGIVVPGTMGTVQGPKEGGDPLDIVVVADECVNTSGGGPLTVMVGANDVEKI